MIGSFLGILRIRLYYQLPHDQTSQQVTAFRIRLITAVLCGVSAAPNTVVSTAPPFIMFLGKNSAVWWQGVAETLQRVCHIKLLPNYTYLLAYLLSQKTAVLIEWIKFNFKT